MVLRSYTTIGGVGMNFVSNIVKEIRKIVNDNDVSISDIHSMLSYVGITPVQNSLYPTHKLQAFCNSPSIVQSMYRKLRKGVIQHDKPKDKEYKYTGIVYPTIDTESTAFQQLLKKEQDDMERKRYTPKDETDMEYVSNAYINDTYNDED